MSLQLGILVSGNGSNLQAILDAIAGRTLDAECRIVISNRPQAFALNRAHDAGVPTLVVDHKEFGSREEFDRELVEQLRARGVEWLVLAGFMRVLTPVLLSAFQGRIINIHPSLLPAFPGVNAQAQALEYGVKVAGCTVHFVDGGVDSGPIIAQRAVEVLAGDSVEDLKQRILQQEHRLLPEVLQALSEGRVKIKERPGQRPLVEFGVRQQTGGDATRASRAHAGQPPGEQEDPQ